MSSKVKSAITTGALTVLVVLLMIFVSGYTFDAKDFPPKTPPDGFEVALLGPEASQGQPDRGRGDEPAPATPAQSARQATGAQQTQTATQQSSTAKVSTSEVPTTQPSNEPPKQEGPNMSNVVKNAFQNSQNNRNTGTGLGDTQTPGNRGNENGDDRSLNTNGPGGGLVGNVRGWKIKTHPKDTYTSTHAGKVVITLTVTVDGNGNVTKADFKSATLYDAELVEKAKQLAMKTKFELKEGSVSGTVARTGEIVVTFDNTQR